MENKQSPSKRKLISIQEEKFIRKIDYENPETKHSRFPKKELVLDLEIFQGDQTQAQPSRKVRVSIKPRVPAIKTLYIAEKNRFISEKDLDKSRERSQLGIGDHTNLNSSFISYFTGNTSKGVLANSYIEKKLTTSTIDSNQISTTIELDKATDILSPRVKCEAGRELQKINVYNDRKRSAEKCYIYTQPQFTMNHPRVEVNTEKNKVDIGTLTSSETTFPVCSATIKRLNKRIAHLERRILRQEMVFRSLDPNIQLSSSDDECKEPNMRATSGPGRPGCSYIQQYSHIPETSAFHRYAQHAAPLSRNKDTTLEKEHNSEQYGRDFTTYDGITARGRRQCASVPCKREDFPKLAAERVHKIRHKLNPVRDYRLMDTVHYLAQGEFAPRDDGIKLTPSREAVLSDIIWEDVCRTHWPGTRLGRRGAPPPPSQGADRGTRGELQRLIDGLLRERVAHVERRRRRHYRIVKLNHRHESCRPVGKTGDIIVASHKNRDPNGAREAPVSDHNSVSRNDRRWEKHHYCKSHRSHDRLLDARQKRRSQEDDCLPGPSYAVPQGPGSRAPTCCYRSVHPTKLDCLHGSTESPGVRKMEITSGSSMASLTAKNPRLILKKEASRTKKCKEESNLEQYILLPTLVIRTPSNVKRQKKFSELYHRILNVQLNNGEEQEVESETDSQNHYGKLKKNTKDVGLTIDVSDTNIKIK